MADVNTQARSTIAAYFSTHSAAENAVRELKEAGFPREPDWHRCEFRTGCIARSPPHGRSSRHGRSFSYAGSFSVK